MYKWFQGKFHGRVVKFDLTSPGYKRYGILHNLLSLDQHSRESDPAPMKADAKASRLTARIAIYVAHNWWMCLFMDKKLSIMHTT